MVIPLKRSEAASLLIGLVSLLIGHGAYALDQFSRACRFDTIPVALQGPAALLFYMLGAPKDTAAMHQRGDNNRYWIFESLTTDYGRVRYYLHAEANVYSWSAPVPALGWAGDYVRRFYYSSGPFRSQMPAEEILRESALGVFFNNRALMYSARAGEGGIYSSFPTMLPMGHFKVLGTHSYWAPAAQTSMLLPKSVAQDCNLGNWGFGLR